MATLEKKDWLLLLLREKPLDRIRLMKALFLIWHRSGRQIGGFYEFVPYMYGPCSFELYEVLNVAEQDQLVSQAPHPVSEWAPYFLTENGLSAAEVAFEKADTKTRRLIKSIASEVNFLGFRELLHRVYFEAPDFATKSVMQEEQKQ